MEQFGGLGKTLIIIGAALTLAGVLISFAGKIPFLGKLPGDFAFKGKNWAVYFPFATSILLSIILSIILYFVNKFSK